MKDKFNREIDYLRISVTENCNLRCVYCTEEELIHSKDYLSSNEIYKISKECAKLGIKKIRLTGGEPLFRNDILDIFEKLNQIEGIEEKYITTNGIYLEKYIDKLVEYGLTGVNISIDSLKDDIFKDLTKSNNLKTVLRGLEKALNHNIKVKVNVVLIEGKNSDEIIDFVNFTKDKKIDVRFIELMPIGLGTKYKGINNDYVRSLIEDKFDVLDAKKDQRSGPANYIKINGYIGKIGFISALSNCFCEECNRVRMTSNGFLKKCLHYNYGADLKSALDSNISEKDLRNLIAETIYDKPEKHYFNEECSDKELKFMNQIGG